MDDTPTEHTNRFRTSHGEWLLRLDIGAMRRIRSNLAVDLLEIITNGELASIFADWVLVGEIVWEVVEAAALRRGVTRQEFLDSIGGDTLLAMSLAFVGAVTRFLPEQDRKDKPAGDANEPAKDPTDTSDPDMWIARLSAIVGFDPAHMTLRELVDAAKTRASNQWDHTAMVLCQTANLHRSEKTPPYPVWKFHPHMAPKVERRKGMSVAQIRAFASVMPTVTVRINPETGEQIVIKAGEVAKVGG